MQQRQTRKIFGLALLSTALLQFTLLIISIATSFFFPIEDDLRPDWPSYLTAVVLLSVAVIGAYQLRIERETTPLSWRAGILTGFTLGIAAALLLSPSPLDGIRIWIVLGWSAVSVTASCMCADRIAWHSRSVREGFWSSILVLVVAFLAMTLTFSLLDSLAFFFFHMGSGLAAPSSFPGFSPLVNYLASYQRIVQVFAIWFLVLVLIDLPLAFASAFISCHTSFRPFAPDDETELAGEEK